jgi:hypothetical protein
MENKESKEELKELESNLKNNVDFKPIKSPIKRFNYFLKDKEGNELSYTEYMARWKKGIEGITPLQQTKGQLNSTYIMLLGILLGFVVTLFNFEGLWWLSIILGGAIFNTGISALGLWQKKKLMERMENLIEEKEVKNK